MAISGPDRYASSRSLDWECSKYPTEDRGNPSQKQGTIIASDVSPTSMKCPFCKWEAWYGRYGRRHGRYGGDAVSVTDVVEWKNEPATCAEVLAHQRKNDDDVVFREITAKLNERIQLTLEAVPLSEFARKMSEVLELDVIIDDRALEDAGLQLDEMVSIQRVKSARVPKIY